MMTQRQLPLEHPKWARDFERSGSLMPLGSRRREPDLSSRLARARMVNLKARESRWHWIALSFISVLIMTDFG